MYIRKNTIVKAMETAMNAGVVATGALSISGALPRTAVSGKKLAVVATG